MSGEVANLKERKNPQTQVYGVKELVTLSTCLSVSKFDHNYLSTGKTEWADFNISSEQFSRLKSTELDAILFLIVRIFLQTHKTSECKSGFMNC